MKNTLLGMTFYLIAVLLITAMVINVSNGTWESILLIIPIMTSIAAGYGSLYGEEESDTTSDTRGKNK